MSQPSSNTSTSTFTCPTPSELTELLSYLTLQERDELDWLLSQPSTPPFQPWLETVTPEHNWRWPHLVYLQDHLNKVTTGEIKRLMVCMPPRHGKSEQTTVRYPVWRLKRDPKMRVIIGAYNATLACKFSRKSRRIAETQIDLADDRTAVEDWETKAGGGMRAVGVGGGITGQGGDLIIIDDPVKNREEAESQTYRDKVWDWYKDDLYTRLEPGGAIILIMTRWHEDDLAGRILASDQGKEWTVVCLPAEAEENDPLGREIGEPLCPERYNKAKLDDLRSTLGSRSYTALYQQRPAPDSGDVFKRQWFRYWSDAGDLYKLEGGSVPKSECTRFVISDLAISEKTSADFTTVFVWGMTPGGHLLLLDWFRDRIDAPTTQDVIKRMSRRWDCDWIGIEDVAYQRSMIQLLRREGMTVKPLKPSGDKVARARAASIRFEASMVHFPQKADWLETLESEMLSFPNGAHDDQVDNVSYACWSASRFHGGELGKEAYTPPAEPQPEKTVEEIATENDANRAKRELEFMFEDD